MAPRAPARPREFDYSNVGKAGRRTGITLKEGKRDEHGMEDLDGMFSSPEKSPVKTTYNGFVNETIMGSSEMDMDHGSGPGPASMLRQSHRSSFIPPPRSRSPIKSMISGSPRRTPGRRPSAVPHSDEMSSSPANNLPPRPLDFSSNRRPVRSPLGSDNSTSSPYANGVGDEGKANAVDSGQGGAEDFSDDGADLVADDPELQGIDQEDSSDNDAEESGINLGDDGLGSDNEETAILEVDADGWDASAVDNVSPPTSLPTSRRTAVEKTKQAEPRAQQETGRLRETNGKEKSEPTPPTTRKRGRPAKKTQTDTSQDNGDLSQNPRPSKKAKPAADKQGNESTELSAQQEKDLDKVVENYANKRGPLKGRSLYILKRETTSDEAATHTRSGRVSVKPLAYWRSERCVFGGGEEAPVGERFPLSTIKEIIRTENLEPEKKQDRRGKGHRKPPKRANKDDQSDDEPIDDEEPWEKSHGVLSGHVWRWDQENQTSTHEEELFDIAYAASKIETREVKDSTFRFAKLISMSFIGSGMVDLPPGGVKKQKNSKKMHMIFYVVHGRVQVDISGTQFSVGKGGVFQVPRGNLYSLTNKLEKTARLFFTQGCVPLDAVDAPPGPPEEDRVATNGKQATKDQKAPAQEKPRPAGGGRGRGRPKTKAT